MSDRVIDPTHRVVRTMSGGDLHESSRAIGALESAVRGLKDAQERGNELFDRHCRDDEERDQRYTVMLAENTRAVAALGQGIMTVTEKLDTLAGKVAVMAPIVDGYQLTRSRLAAWASIGLSVVVVLGWIVEAAVKWLVHLVLSHWN